ncbi:MAG TPA: hypothetical protein QF468_08025 [Nitrospinota bacterium]|jgi:phosphopentomutase|nr:hypothetical protein [Nitrospinota bacterium]|tara:strand:- start:290 stop:514 length:225 start_codon:yes stop_codon:yes gene_type:complete
MPVRFKRILLIILDSLGVGELPDASKYGDPGTRQTFADLGATVADNFGVSSSNKSNQALMTSEIVGTSFLDYLS